MERSKQSGDRTEAVHSKRTARGREEVWKREWFFY